MITDYNTVFILGAGASCPYGFPTAEGLKNDICTNYSKKIRHLREDINPEQLNGFINLFKYSGEISIDNFLARYEKLDKFKYVISHGKAAIFISISNFERNSPLYNDFLQIRDDWYGWIYRKMRPFNDISDLSKNKVSFITFNYDRSLEHYFLTSLCNSFGYVNKSIIMEKLSSIPIVHVYGELGSLEEMDDNYLSFGGKCNFIEISKFKDNIKTMYERNENRNEKIDEILKDAEKIFILGFGFDKENVQFLKLKKYLSDRVYNTYISNFDCTDEKFQIILRQAEFKDWRFNIRKGSCLKVLEENFFWD